MISVEEARSFVTAHLRDFGNEMISLDKGIGRILREEWRCDRDLPPYDRVTMDGIALSYDNVDFDLPIDINGIAKAGDPIHELVGTQVCLEAMTGAVLPQGADTVIRYEDIQIEGSKVTVLSEVVKNQNVHHKGTDRKQGDLLVPEGTLLSPAEIGVGSSIGRHQIQVTRAPRIMIISTGDELVEIDQTPLPHQIRRGNVYRVQSILSDIGVTCDTDHLPDDLEVIKDRIAKYIELYDAIILSGGVSKGKLDFVPEALKSCGVKEVFHKIKQRPGKPMWFGVHETGAIVFGLPGNPVSSFMCFKIYVMNWLRGSLGMKNIQEHAILDSEVVFKPDLTYFLEVELYQDDQCRLRAIPKKGNGSGDLANLVEADAFIELTKGQDLYEPGGIYPIHRYR